MDRRSPDDEGNRRYYPYAVGFSTLETYTNIHEGNALRMDWETVIAKNKLNYIMGNPPFVGFILRSKESTRELLIFL